MDIKNITIIQKKGSIKNDKTLDRKKKHFICNDYFCSK